MLLRNCYMFDCSGCVIVKISYLFVLSIVNNGYFVQGSRLAVTSQAGVQ